MRGNPGMFGGLFWFPRRCGWKDRTAWLQWGWGGKDSEVSVFHGLMLLSGWSPEVGSLKLMKEFAAFMGGRLLVGTEHRSLQTACGQQGRASVPVAQPLDMSAGGESVSGKGPLPAHTWCRGHP